ncbi:MAG: GNAT family N-acetyltransferase [Balneolaceae bacterium]|nr:MAG: GNAT family N-acetyltransferase [Balneolaceae bacterium]
MKIIALHGREILPKTEQIARVRIEVFREYPYLYDGSLSYEKNYLQTYADSPESIALLVMDGEEIAGVSTGLPMEDETDEFKAPFLTGGWSPGHIFYCGESILKRKYRGRGLYSLFMRGREEHARSLKRFSLICFCAVIRPDTHPLRPAGYRPLDAVWEKFGYQKEDRLTTNFTWKDLNEERETLKEMVFWIKKL